MSFAPPYEDDLTGVLKALDGRPYDAYRQLSRRSFDLEHGRVEFLHIQGSPGAFPATVGRLRLSLADLNLVDSCLANKPRQMATADYLLRAWRAGVEARARQNRGAQGSGSYQPLDMIPQVLQRNLVDFDPEGVQIAFRVSLPASHDNRILGREAAPMFSHELAGIVETLKAWGADAERLKMHCDVVEDAAALQQQLSRYGLVAFIADGARLPRKSGVSQAPLDQGAVAFQAPPSLAVTVEVPNAGRIRGLGIRPGVSVLIGGGFHGKSTLLNALVMGVYPHIPGDGRERVVTHRDAAFICAEDGRAVSGLDISAFIHNLPGNVDTEAFWTQNASGSTSEAAAIIEAVLAGAKLLLIDEDSSATNFLIKDRQMRRLLPEDTITPLFDRVQELYRRFGVSTLMAVGGSSDYLAAADQVIAMQDYLPVCMTEAVRHLSLSTPQPPAKPLELSDRRRLLADNFDPSCRVQRLNKTLPVRIKPLRLQERILEYGDQQLDLTRLRGLVDPDQVVAIGYALLLARRGLATRSLSPTDLADALSRTLAQEGLSILPTDEQAPRFLAIPRRLELAGAINRLRNLRVKVGAASP